MAARRGGLEGRLVTGAACAALLSGCSFLGMTATNARPPYAVMDAARQRVRLVFPQPAGSSKATFRVRNLPKEATGYTDPAPDQAPDGHAAGTLCESVSPGNFCVELDPTKLPENIYLVDVYLDDDTTQSRGVVAFVAPAVAPAASATRSGYVVSDAQGAP